MIIKDEGIFFPTYEAEKPKLIEVDYKGIANVLHELKGLLEAGADSNAINRVIENITFSKIYVPRNIGGVE